MTAPPLFSSPIDLVLLALPPLVAFSVPLLLVTLIGLPHLRLRFVFTQSLLALILPLLLYLLVAILFLAPILSAAFLFLFLTAELITVSFFAVYASTLARLNLIRFITSFARILRALRAQIQLLDITPDASLFQRIFNFLRAITLTHLYTFVTTFVHSLLNAFSKTFPHLIDHFNSATSTFLRSVDLQTYAANYLSDPDLPARITAPLDNITASIHAIADHVDFHSFFQHPVIPPDVYASLSNIRAASLDLSDNLNLTYVLDALATLSEHGSAASFNTNATVFAIPTPEVIAATIADPSPMSAPNNQTTFDYLLDHLSSLSLEDFLDWLPFSARFLLFILAGFLLILFATMLLRSALTLSCLTLLSHRQLRVASSLFLPPTTIAVANKPDFLHAPAFTATLATVAAVMPQLIILYLSAILAPSWVPARTAIWLATIVLSAAPLRAAAQVAVAAASARTSRLWFAAPVIAAMIVEETSMWRLPPFAVLLAVTLLFPGPALMVTGVPSAIGVLIALGWTYWVYRRVVRARTAALPAPRFVGRGELVSPRRPPKTPKIETKGGTAKKGMTQVKLGAAGTSTTAKGAKKAAPANTSKVGDPMKKDREEYSKSGSTKVSAAGSTGSQASETKGSVVRRKNTARAKENVTDVSEDGTDSPKSDKAIVREDDAVVQGAAGGEKTLKGE